MAKDAGETSDKKGSQRTKKRKKKKQTQQVLAASRIVFVSGKAQRARIQERGSPPAFVNERGSQCTCEERERSAGKKKTTNQVQGHRARDPPLMFARERVPVHL